MTIELRPEDKAKLERVVASGEFATLGDALHAAIDEFTDETWKQYASDRIEAGWADMEAGRTTPWEEVHARLTARMRKQA